MVDHIFRQYDIRGKIGPELAISEIYALVQSIAYYFKEQAPDIKTVAVGADGRIHSPAIKEQICRGLQDAGLDVIFIGICPTPVLYFSLFQLPVDAGLMITASHNGKDYNGIKICLNKESVWGKQIQEIKHLYKEEKYIKAQKLGVYQECPMIETYVMWLADHFAHLKKMQLSAIIDCGNGAGGTVLPLLCKIMEWENIKLLYSEIDGTYPHHEADPTQEQNMLDIKAILNNSDIHIGIGLDGDADRMVPMTKKGELVLGDKLLALYAQEIVQNYQNFSVVYDIKCSAGLPEVLQSLGITPYMSPTGHSIIKMNLKKYAAILAGELSCHFFFADRYFGYDDGIYAMMRLFEILCRTDKTLDELLLIFPKKIATREIRFACDYEMQNIILEQVYTYFKSNTSAEINTLDGIRAALHGGWGILRQSHTQPVLSARFEADTFEQIMYIKKEFIHALASFYDPVYLYDIFK